MRINMDIRSWYWIEIKFTHASALHNIYIYLKQDRTSNNINGNTSFTTLISNKYRAFIFKTISRSRY